MKKNKISKNWVNKQRRDTYVRQSKVDGYRARSAYKLIEIDEKFKIFKGGISVIDIGAAPGSWSQYAAKAAKSGRLISIDLKEMEPIGNTVQIQGDFTEESTQDKIREHINNKVDVVMSDMAVNTTGIKNIDSIQTGELCKEAMFFAKDQLKNNGYINKTVSLVDRKRVGANVTAMVSIKVNNHNQERISIFSKTIQDIPEVIECYRMSGETDYLLKVVVSDIESYDAFYKNLIEKVQFLKVTSNFAIEEIKSTTEIPLTKLGQ